MQPQELAGRDPGQQSGKHREVVAGPHHRVAEDAQRAGDAEDQGEEAEPGGQALLHPARDACAGKQPDRRTDQDGGHVQERAAQKHRPIVRTR